VTNSNVTLATAQAQWKKNRQFIRGAAITARSIDEGLSFEQNQTRRPRSAQMLYSSQTNTIHAFGLAVPNASADALTWSISHDDGVTFSAPVVAMDGPGWGAGEGAHGVELQHGPHRGRLMLPYGHASTSRDRYAACAMAVFSDDHGTNWTMGGLLPPYTGESALTELKNGSVLITFRCEQGAGSPPMKHARGFARSDNGGETWAQIWYLDECCPSAIDGPSQQGIDRSAKTGLVYFGHPGSTVARANYTIHRSSNDGLTWDYVGVIYPGGAGYSDVHVLPHDGAGDRLGVAFQRTLYDPNLEGGGYNMAWAEMTIPLP
jgi:hypothetical protein